MSHIAYAIVSWPVTKLDNIYEFGWENEGIDYVFKHCNTIYVILGQIIRNYLAPGWTNLIRNFFVKIYSLAISKTLDYVVTCCMFGVKTLSNLDLILIDRESH